MRKDLKDFLIFEKEQLSLNQALSVIERCLKFLSSSDEDDFFFEEERHNFITISERALSGEPFVLVYFPDTPPEDMVDEYETAVNVIVRDDIYCSLFEEGVPVTENAFPFGEVVIAIFSSEQPFTYKNKN